MLIHQELVAPDTKIQKEGRRLAGEMLIRQSSFASGMRIFAGLLPMLLLLVTPEVFAQKGSTVSASTITLLYVLVLVFPIVSGIVIFFITRGILQGLRATRNLSKKDKVINFVAAVGGFFVVLLVVVFQLRATV